MIRKPQTPVVIATRIIPSAMMKLFSIRQYLYLSFLGPTKIPVNMPEVLAVPPSLRTSIALRAPENLKIYL